MTGTASAMSGKRVEDAAVLFVIEHERREGRKACDVRYTGADGDVASDGRMIEIKAAGKSARGNDIWLESRQYDAARARDDFWVYVVDNVAQGDPERFGLVELDNATLVGLFDKAREHRTYTVPLPVKQYDERRLAPGGRSGTPH